MILECTITDSMISSVISISEKIGQIKEIRSSHNHIDFNLMCNVKNVQDILRARGVFYPDRIITELMESKSSAKKFYEDNRIVNEEVDRYRRVRDRRSYHPSYFKENLHRAGPRKLEPQPQIPREVVARLTTTDNFFLYKVAEFCDACRTIINQTDILQLWLTTLFLEEYGMLLYFPYSNILVLESSIIRNGKRLIDKLEYEANTKKERYRLIEFYMSVIDSTLDECLRIHYKLSNPTSGRVEMLQGEIKEPFSRKDYMAYHNGISSATASLDLKKAVDKGILLMGGDKRTARYWYK